MEKKCGIARNCAHDSWTVWEPHMYAWTDNIKKSWWLDRRTMASCERSGSDLRKRAFCARYRSTPTVVLSHACSLTTTKKNREREQKTLFRANKMGAGNRNDNSFSKSFTHNFVGTLGPSVRHLTNWQPNVKRTLEPSVPTKFPLNRFIFVFVILPHHFPTEPTKSVPSPHSCYAGCFLFWKSTNAIPNFYLRSWENLLSKWEQIPTGAV